MSIRRKEQFSGFTLGQLSENAVVEITQFSIYYCYRIKDGETVGSIMDATTLADRIPTKLTKDILQFLVRDEQERYGMKSVVDDDIKLEPLGSTAAAGVP